GDKAAPKAQSNAMKYALLMGFLLSTGDDPEQTDTSDRQSRPAPPRLPARHDWRTVEPPSTDVTAASTPYQEAEELIGRVRRRGIIRNGSAESYKLDARIGPEGHAIGFRLEVGPEKHIPQCLVAGPLGELLYQATSEHPETLVGVPATVAGILYYVKDNRDNSWYRLHVDRIDTKINGLDVI